MKLEEKGKDLFKQAFNDDNDDDKNKKTIIKAKKDHLVNEEDDSFSEHSIISIKKGEEVVLIDGDLINGLKPPYQDYVLVERCKDYEIGRVSKFVFI